MLIGIYVSVLVINYALFLIKKNSKIVSVLSFLSLVLIMGGNTYNPDMANYRWYYQNSSYPLSMELGYVCLSNTVHNIGLNYNSFVTLIVIMCFVVYFICISRFCCNYHFIIASYMSFLMFYDVTQIRNMIFCTLYFVGLILLESNKKILFIIVILIASMIHRSAYIILLFASISPNSKWSKKLIKLAVATIAILCVFTFLGGNRIPFISYFLENALGAYTDKLVYFNNETRFGFLKAWACQFMNIFIINISKKYIDEIDDISIEYKNFVNVVYLATLVSCFAMPLTMMDINFTRYFRMNNIAMYLVITIIVNLSMQSTENDWSHSVPLVGNKRGAMNIYYSLIILDLFLWLFMIHPGLVNDILRNNLYL